MVKALLPYMPFPPLTWWAVFLAHESVRLDGSGRFRKQGLHQRYRVAAANGPLLLTIPLEGGRDQRGSLNDLRIDNRQPWARQHWRSLFSAYGRAPFFEHYAPPLETLLEAGRERLTDFCGDSIAWMARELGLGHRLDPAVLLPDEDLESWADLRQWEMDPKHVAFPRYPQVFELRNGFLPNLSLLDLLMNEGPAARHWLLLHGPQLYVANP